MSQWTNEYAILRDLSVAQGRVPVAIEGTVGAGDKPPSLNITEETEEEFFKHCSADADVSAAPDLGLIKKMLDMVRDINVLSDEEDSLNKVVVISKLNPKSSEFIPKNNNTSTPLESPKKQKNEKPKKQKNEKPKKRQQRNIALESILQAIANKTDNTQNDDALINPEPMKLLKPNDFISNNEVTEKVETPEVRKSVQNEEPQKTVLDKNDTSKTATSNVSPAPAVVEKVNGWLKTQTESPFPKKTSKVLLQASTSMFKKKSVTEKVKKVESTTKSPNSSNEEYKPSTLANEYYQKYVERNKFKESVKDSIWSRAEKRMKEIDERRKWEAIQALTSASSSSQASENENRSSDDTQSTHSVGQNHQEKHTTLTKINRCLEMVTLPQHRHLLTGNCIVCEVMTTKYSEPIKEKEIHSDQTKEESDINYQIDKKTEEDNLDTVVVDSDSEVVDMSLEVIHISEDEI